MAKRALESLERDEDDAALLRFVVVLKQSETWRYSSTRLGKMPIIRKLGSV